MFVGAHTLPGPTAKRLPMKVFTALTRVTRVGCKPLPLCPLTRKIVRMVSALLARTVAVHSVALAAKESLLTGLWYFSRAAYRSFCCC